MSERPRSEWSAPQIVLTIVLALLAGQQTYNNFNNDTAQRMARIEARVDALIDNIREYRQRDDERLKGIIEDSRRERVR
jgi:hypothetical protein